jgi:SAM-dependent methyltransferase
MQETSVASSYCREEWNVMERSPARLIRSQYRRFLAGVERTVATAVRSELRAAAAGAAVTKPQQSASPSPTIGAPQVSPQIDINAVIAEVWERNEDESYRQDQSHWRGVGRWDVEQWAKIGDETWRRLGDAYRTAGRSVPTDPKPVVLEWGPGGGSNLFRLAEHCSVLYGVDISLKNLDESARVLAEKDRVDFRPILLTDDPSSVVDSITDPINLFFSSQVFQHFPSKEYGIEVLRTMRSLMSDDGIGYIQIRFDNGNPTYAPKSVFEYREKHITATAYELSEFWAALIDAGFTPMKIGNLNLKSNFAGFYFQVRSG